MLCLQEYEAWLKPDGISQLVADRPLPQQAQHASVLETGPWTGPWPARLQGVWDAACKVGGRAWAERQAQAPGMEEEEEGAGAPKRRE